MPKQEIVGILDRSGSMRGKETDTVGGINTMLEEVKKNKQSDDDIKVSLKLFDNEEILKWRHEPIDSITEFPLEEFVPRGSTALHDALGHTLTYFMELKLLDPEAYDTCLIYVATDGLENASTKYNRETLKKLIANAKETYSIDIIYLGANQDAILEADNLGISAERAINYSETDGATQAVYRSVGRIASQQRSDRNIHFTETEREASVS